jgi:thiol-disulfide isomerase/thioredoxin
MKPIAAVVLLACAGWAVYAYALAPEPLEALAEVPESPPAGSVGGIVDVSYTPGPIVPEPGRHTVIEFYTLRCPGCRRLSRYLDDFSRRRPDVAIRTVKLDREAAAQFEVRSVPHVLIYDSDGDLVVADRGRDKAGLDLLQEWMQQEARRH